MVWLNVLHLQTLPPLVTAKHQVVKLADSQLATRWTRRKRHSADGQLVTGSSHHTVNSSQRPMPVALSRVGQCDHGVSLDLIGCSA